MPRTTYCWLALIVMPLGCASAAEQAIPLQIVNNFPVVDVLLNGKPIPVAVDLGGDDTIELTTTALSKVKVRYLQDRYTWLDAKGHRLEARKFVIPELRIGSAVFRNVEGHEDAEAPDWPKIRAGQGRLGRSLFDPAWNGEAVSKAGTDVGELTFVWDTGAPMSFIQAKLGLASTKTLLLAGRDFGPLQLRSMAFVQPEGVDGFIGYDFFAQHRVCIDFPGRAFWIQ